MKRLLLIAAGATLVVGAGGGTAAYAAHSAQQSRAHARYCAPLLASDHTAARPYEADVAEYRQLSTTNRQNSKPVILLSLKTAQDMMAAQQHGLEHPDCYSADDVKLGRQEIANLRARIQYELGRLAKA